MGRGLTLVVMLVALLGALDYLRVQEICLVWRFLMVGLRNKWQGVRRVVQGLCGTDGHRFFRREKVQEAGGEGSQVQARLRGM